MEAIDNIWIDPKPPSIKVSIAGPGHLLRINRRDGTLLIEIDEQGKPTYGPDYTPDAAAREFWEALGVTGYLTVDLSRLGSFPQ